VRFCSSSPSRSSSRRRDGCTYVGRSALRMLRLHIRGKRVQPIPRGATVPGTHSARTSFLRRAVARCVSFGYPKTRLSASYSAR
jgi:hypothetical protein